MFKSLYHYIIKNINKLLFRKKNKHNSIKLISEYPINKIKIGNDSYGNLDIKAYNKKGIIKIGNYCSIAESVKFLIGGEHNYKRISTFPFQSIIYNKSTKDNINYNITIEDDVWIGYDCLIMSGTKIGKGSVIGARSIVKSDIPPYSIYVGNKVIKKRFNECIINKINNIDFSKINHKKNDEYEKYCQTEITEENVEEIVKKFE